MSPANLHTMNGQVPADEVGTILPHEHIFTDLRGPNVVEYANADPEVVSSFITPHLEAAYQVGVTTIVECSTVGVGRNMQILKRIAEETPIHIIPPTGVYREEYIPTEFRAIDAQELAEHWISEMTTGIEDTGIRAGFIKIALSDEGPTVLEERNLVAAAMASEKTGAIVACHTPNGESFLREMEILEGAGLDPGRFIWVHANLEADRAIHLEAARRGVFVEFDAVGADWQSQDELLMDTLHLIEQGFVDHILLSHDAGWFDPGQKDGVPEGGFRGYTDLTHRFLPALQTRGLADDDIHQMTVVNPTRAFAIT